MIPPFIWGREKEKRENQIICFVRSLWALALCWMSMVYSQQCQFDIRHMAYHFLSGNVNWCFSFLTPIVLRIISIVIDSIYLPDNLNYNLLLASWQTFHAMPYSKLYTNRMWLAAMPSANGTFIHTCIHT